MDGPMVVWGRRLSRALRKKDDVGCAEGCLNNYVDLRLAPRYIWRALYKESNCLVFGFGQMVWPSFSFLVVLPGAATVPKSENSKGWSFGMKQMDISEITSVTQSDIYWYFRLGERSASVIWRQDINQRTKLPYRPESMFWVFSFLQVPNFNLEQRVSILKKQLEACFYSCLLQLDKFFYRGYVSWSLRSEADRLSTNLTSSVSIPGQRTSSSFHLLVPVSWLRLTKLFLVWRWMTAESNCVG